MSYTSANTSRFTFSIADQPDLHNQLRVYQFELQESLNDHFCLSLDFICTDQALDYSALLSKTALLTIQGENEIQYLNGIISEACSIENGTRFARYSVKLVPMAQFLEYRKGCRIFQNLSVPEIITQVFDEAGLSDGRHYQWRTDRQYPQRDFCTQYNETEWQFISRLMAEEGIHFHYLHSADKHLLCLGDSKSALSFIDDVQHIPFKNNSGLFEAGSTAHNEHINQLQFSREVQSGKSTFRDYNFKTPSRNLEKSDQNCLAIELEDYQYPGLYNNVGQAEFYAHLRQEQHNALLIRAQGKSNVQRLRAGRLYTQTEHRYQTNNIDQLITAISHYGKQPQSLDEDSPTANNEGSSYYNEFTCMPASTPFRPQPAAPRPIIHGLQHAFVTGPDGEEIYTNQYGQVKVQFLWDREAQNDEKTSCWMRTSNESSGNSWGQIMTPRIGQHILIEFEQGNPDRPIISGRSYNGDHLPPYSLPDNKTRSTTKTCSSPGAGGYNEIRLEDKKSQEQIYFHSEKDLDIRCKNDRREHIKNNRSLIVENEQYEYIKSDQHQKIDQSLQYQVGSNLSQSIGQQLNIKTGSQYLQSAGNDVHIKSGQSTVLDAGSEITFKASGGFIKIDASGVTINGITVNLNSGGGAGSASRASPTAPSQAVEADKNKPGQSFKVIAPQKAYKLSKFAFNNGAGGAIKLASDKISTQAATVKQTSVQIDPQEPFEVVIATEDQSIEQYLSQTYDQPDKVIDVFKLLNSHLKNDRILPLQIIILPHQDLQACPKIPNEITEVIAEIETLLGSLESPRDNELAYNHFDLLEAIDNNTPDLSTSLGVASSGFSKTNEAIKNTLINIETAYIKHYNNPAGYPKAEFFSYRQQQFKNLDNILGRLLLKQMRYNVNTDIKRQLGLKIGQKKLAKGAKSGSLPSYAKNLQRVVQQAKLLKSFGYIGTGLEIANSGMKIHEACTIGREEECTKIKYTEGGYLAGSIGGGMIGASAGTYLICNVVFGIESAATSLLWCALIAGGIGAGAGGNYASKQGRAGGEFFYRELENDQ